MAVKRRHENEKKNKRGESKEREAEGGENKQGWGPAAVIGCRSSNDKPDRVAQANKVPQDSFEPNLQAFHHGHSCLPCV